MTEAESTDFVTLFEDLTGQGTPFPDVDIKAALPRLQAGEFQLGYSQLNEVLLLLGYDRVAQPSSSTWWTERPSTGPEP